MKKNDLTILAFLVVGLLALLVAFLLIGDDEADLEPERSPPAATSASETPRRSASHAGHGKESKPPRPAASPSNDKEEDTAAQPTRALEGRVLDLEGKPVPGAHVIYRARLEDRELRLEARADPEGRYRLEGIPFAATRTPFRLPSPVFLIRAKGFAPRRLVAAAIGLSDPGLGAVVRRDFRLARGGSLRIRVVDMAEGLPIAGATVTLYGKASFPAPFDLDAPLASLITDEDGIAHLSPFLTSKGALLDPLGSLKGFIVRAEHPGFAAMGTFAFPVEEEGETRNVTLRLPLSAALEGRVLDAQGQPQRNALVEVDLDPWATRAVGTVDGRSTAPIAPRRLFHEPPTFDTGSPAVLRALTNERGRYVFEGLPAKARGTTTAHVTARMSDLVAGSITAILVAGQTTVVDDLRLDVNPDALVVRGLVEDEEGRPIGRARVEAERAEPVETDGTGAFTVILSRGKLPKKGLPALTVEAEGYAKWMGEIPDPVPSEGLRMVLQRPHGLEGSVVDAAGEPMPDVFVTAADTTSRFSSTVATDGAGRFHFTRLPASRFRVSASQRFMDSHGTLPRFGHAEPIEDVPADTKDLLIRFSEAAPPTGSVRVRLLDARDGRPILTTPRVEVIGENLQRRGTPESAGTMVFPRLPMGEYQLRVEAKGYLSASRRVRVRSEGGPTVEEFRLEPAVGILVEPEVIDARELPSSAKIILIMSGGQGQGAFSYTQDFGEPIRLDNLHPGRWKLTAQILVRRRVVRSATKSVVINLAPRSGITRVRLRLVPVGSGKTPR